MNPTQTEAPIETGNLASTAPNSLGAGYESCESCGAPLDHRQRYCVNCAARRPDPENPANRYFASAGRRSRTAAPVPVAGEQAAPLRGAAVLLLVLMPIAVAIGVMVGRSGAGETDNSDLISALQNAGPGTATASETVSNTGGDIPSSFPLEKGYTVSLQVLPEDKTDAAAVSAAEDDATSKGAEDVGVINQKDFSLSPDVGDGYVIYSGEFKSKGDADKALDDLKGDFGDAKVIKVTAAGGGGSSPAGEPVDHTQYGDVHDVTQLQPSDEAGQLGLEIAEDQANQTGEDYIKGQQGLPDVIQVGP
jgi:hypothetical protein